MSELPSQVIKRHPPTMLIFTCHSFHSKFPMEPFFTAVDFYHLTVIGHRSMCIVQAPEALFQFRGFSPIRNAIVPLRTMVPIATPVDFHFLGLSFVVKSLQWLLISLSKSKHTATSVGKLSFAYMKKIRPVLRYRRLYIYCSVYIYTMYR